jgi:sugar phosphate permease
MNTFISRRLSFHYGWVIVAAGALGIFACIGLARFALGMLLPAMGQELQLTYAQMGAISTANFLGYLAGILGTAPLVRRFGARYCTGVALLLSGLAMVGIGFSSSLIVIIGFYILTGVGSAMANIPIMAVLSSWFSSRLRGKAAGLVVSGNGAAIVFAGQAVPWMNGLTIYNWRLSWAV